MDIHGYSFGGVVKVLLQSNRHSLLSGRLVVNLCILTICIVKCL